MTEKEAQSMANQAPFMDGERGGRGTHGEHGARGAHGAYVGYGAHGEHGGHGLEVGFCSNGKRKETL